VPSVDRVDEAWHFPPELLELLVGAIARLNRSKAQVVDYFRGAGVPRKHLDDVAARVASNPGAISKYEIARTVLVRLNDGGDGLIGPRREVLNQVVKTESFESCWPDDRYAAMGLVAEIRTVVDKRDSFTRMKKERDRERDERLEGARAEREKRERALKERSQLKDELFALFNEADPWKRGKQLEGVNRIFALDGVSVRESFHLTGDEGEGIVEQIDGVISLDNELYLVEMKWLAEKVGPDVLAPHYSRVFLRHTVSGIFISASDFTEPAITQTKTALTRMVSILCGLDELVFLLERGGDLRIYFREKVQAAKIDRNPYHRPSIP
jgi:hypothetical protein